MQCNRQQPIRGQTHFIMHSLTCNTRLLRPVLMESCLRSLASGLWFSEKYDFMTRSSWCLNDVLVRFCRVGRRSIMSVPPSSRHIASPSNTTQHITCCAVVPSINDCLATLWQHGNVNTSQHSTHSSYNERHNFASMIMLARRIYLPSLVGIRPLEVFRRNHTHTDCDCFPRCHFLAHLIVWNTFTQSASKTQFGARKWPPSKCFSVF